MKQEDYCALLERFREHCRSRGLTFQAGMRQAIAAAMGEEPTIPPRGRVRCRPSASFLPKEEVRP